MRQMLAGKAGRGLLAVVPGKARHVVPSVLRRVPARRTGPATSGPDVRALRHYVHPQASPVPVLLDLPLQSVDHLLQRVDDVLFDQLRFLADIVLDSGETITASCPNTGAMLGLTEPGSVVWVSANDSPTRKYRHTLEIVEADLGKGGPP